MFAKLCIIKLLIVAFVIAHCESNGTDVNQEALKHYETELALAKTLKHDLCFSTNLTECGCSEYPSPEKEIVRWHYVPTTKACAPLYMVRGQNITCYEIWSLTNTKKECEDLCGEPCPIIYASKLSEPGICMMDCHIVHPAGVRKPCPGDARCCPRGYVLPTTTPVPVKTTKARTDN